MVAVAGRVATPALLIFALLVPVLFYQNRYMLDLSILVLTYVMLGWGLNIVVGLAGLLDLGYVAFYAIGAYTTAFLASSHFDIHISWWIVIWIAVAAAALFGIMLGAPTLKLRGDYLAIVTLGFGEIVRLVFLNIKYTQMVGTRLVGPNGAEGFRHVSYIYQGGYTQTEYLGVIFLGVLVVVVLVHFLERSKLGAQFRAVEEDEIAAAMAGVNVTAVKVLAFTLSGFVAGLGGALFVHYSTYIDHDMVALPLAVAAVTYAMVGVLGSYWGAIFGALVLIGLTEGLRFAQEFRLIIYGALIIVTMVFRPRGVIDETFVARMRALFRKRALAREAA